MRSVVLALLVLALAPAGAAAETAPSLTLALAKPAATYGQAHSLSGVLSGSFAVRTPQTVVLEGERAPFTGGFREIARTVTDAGGAFRFAPKLDGNYKLRAAVAALAISSPIVHAYTFPAVALTFRSVRARRVELLQRYTVPPAVRLTAPTLFYLGARKAARSTLKARGETRRVRAGHFLARAAVTIPTAWHGSFRFGSCFRNSPGAGMGTPHVRCPRRFRF